MYRAQRPARKEESGVALPSPYAGASRLCTTVVVAVVAGESKRVGQSGLTAPARRCPKHGLAVAAEVALFMRNTLPLQVRGRS